MRCEKNVTGRLFDKVWDRHLVASPQGEPPLLFIDLHLVHEVPSPQAFEGLELAGRRVRSPRPTVAPADQGVPAPPVVRPLAHPLAGQPTAPRRPDTAAPNPPRHP